MHKPMEEIEVGAADGTFRNWFAAEAKWMGEAALKAQTALLAGMAARATAILALSTGAIIALATFPARDYTFAPALCAGVFLFAAAIACVAGMWPHNWYLTGASLDWLEGLGQQTELQVNEAIARGCATSIERNDRHLRKVQNCLRIAWVSFILAPVAAGLAAIFIR